MGSCRTRCLQPWRGNHPRELGLGSQVGKACCCRSWERRHLRTVHNCSSRRVGRVHDRSTADQVERAMLLQPIQLERSCKTSHSCRCSGSLVPSRGPVSRTLHLEELSFRSLESSVRRLRQAPSCMSAQVSVSRCCSRHRRKGTWQQL